MSETTQITPERMLELIELQNATIQSVRNAVAALLEAMPAILRETLEKDSTPTTSAPTVTTPQQPNTHWAGKKLPTGLTDPKTLPQTDKAMRAWLKDSVSTISKWFSLPGRHLPMETVYRTIYNRYSDATDFNIWANYERYSRLVGNKPSILDMLVDLGRLDGICYMVQACFGNQQPFEMCFDFNTNRTINFTPVGRKTGVKYSWNKGLTPNKSKQPSMTSKIDIQPSRATTNQQPYRPDVLWPSEQLRQVAEQLRQDLTTMIDKDAWFASQNK